MGSFPSDKDHIYLKTYFLGKVGTYVIFTRRTTKHSVDKRTGAQTFGVLSLNCPDSFAFFFFFFFFLFLPFSVRNGDV